MNEINECVTCPEFYEEQEQPEQYEIKPTQNSKLASAIVLALFGFKKE